MFVILIVSIGSPFKSHSLCASEALLETHDVLKMCIADVSKPRHVPRWTIHGEFAFSKTSRLVPLARERNVLWFGEVCNVFWLASSRLLTPRFFRMP